jgi:DNA polymerase-3 subunit epsilon
VTTIDEPRLEHHGQCVSWKTNNVEDCDCRDDQGHTPRPPAGSWADGRLMAFDLETTGKDPLEARIVTATAIDIKPKRKPVVSNWLSDVDGEEIPEEAAAIHGISTEKARAEGRPLREVVEQVRAALEWAWQHGVPVVGHNVSYDLTVMAAECRRLGMPEFKVTGYVIDSIVLDRGADKWRKGKRTLTAACEVYGIQLSAEDAHNSDADALASARVAWKIAKKYPELGSMRLDDLQTWQRDAHRTWAEGFGAYLVRQGKVDDVQREWPLRTGA